MRPAPGGVLKGEGSAWSALGGGAKNEVRALAVSGTNLYVGGYFTSGYSSGTTTVAATVRIAKWNGSAWSSAVGLSAMDATVNALAVSGTNLYVGGNFTSAGGVAGTGYIAKWDGSGWSALGGTLGGVRTLAVSGTTLYVGGQFNKVYSSGTTVVPGATFIAKWNGSAWSALGSGANGTVTALAVSGTDLYVGGDFNPAGGGLGHPGAGKGPGHVQDGPRHRHGVDVSVRPAAGGRPRAPVPFRDVASTPDRGGARAVDREEGTAHVQIGPRHR